jgi:hypothetical protein
MGPQKQTFRHQLATAVGAWYHGSLTLLVGIAAGCKKEIAVLLLSPQGLRHFAVVLPPSSATAAQGQVPPNKCTRDGRRTSSYWDPQGAHARQRCARCCRFAYALALLPPRSIITRAREHAHSPLIYALRTAGTRLTDIYLRQPSSSSPKTRLPSSRASSEISGFFASWAGTLVRPRSLLLSTLLLLRLFAHTPCLPAYGNDPHRHIFLPALCNFRRLLSEPPSFLRWSNLFGQLPSSSASPSQLAACFHTPARHTSSISPPHRHLLPSSLPLVGLRTFACGEASCGAWKPPRSASTCASRSSPSSRASSYVTTTHTIHRHAVGHGAPRPAARFASARSTSTSPSSSASCCGHPRRHRHPKHRQQGALAHAERAVAHPGHPPHPTRATRFFGTSRGLASSGD